MRRVSSAGPPGTAGVADRVHSAALRLLRRLRRTAVASDVGPARLSVLSILVFGGNRTLGELAAAEQVRPPTMTRIVRGLEAQGLVTKDQDEDDGRVFRVSVTGRGRTLLQRARRRRLESLTAMLDQLPARGDVTLDRAAKILLGIVQ